MGDSAKVVSPFGARGGNTGIADADNLAWKLAAVLQGLPRRSCWTATTRSGTRRQAERAGDQPHGALPAAGRRRSKSCSATRR
jgi:2-polyprenyl-6-methoxyphenol hydroxylase-like FAD-dependent oxidoreductase